MTTMARIPKQNGVPTMPKPLVFVTGNANKLAEVKAILGDAVPGLENKALDLPELQGTIEDVTLDKARRAAQEVCADRPCVMKC
jgi:inosine triphosphate pyrophosphatase